MFLLSVYTLVCFLDALATAEVGYDDMPWYDRLSAFHFPTIAALDLGETEASILPTVRNSTANFVLIEFYAPWCPHCQYFAPEYERLAFAAQHQVGDELMVAKVDCVRYAGTCSKFSVDGYPTLLWGRREDWLSHKGLQEVRLADGSAEAAADWINVNSLLRIDLQQASQAEVAKMLEYEKGGDAARHMKGLQQTVADQWDMQLASVLLIRFSLTAHASSRRHMRALRDFVHLLSERFPEQLSTGSAEQGELTYAAPCRESLRQLHHELGALADHPGSPEFHPDALEARWQFCGTAWNDYGSKGWSGCRGTWPGNRGFTCGLWTLFHAITARGSDKTASSDTLIIRNAITQLFDCKDCRDHFLHIPWNPESTATRDDAQLWWWQAHNRVNARLERMEKQNGDGDPAFPKVQWPPSTVCPRCQGASPGLGFLRRRQPGHAWDKHEVVVFLRQFYGENL
mmetsp:Transcript_13483/g.26506  ORF Transcript_13483/g.26506 Transcript_13483/m.26506 type:complete len:457 (+) Transcript_13483:48-1418(+)